MEGGRWLTLASGRGVCTALNKCSLQLLVAAQRQDFNSDPFARPVTRSAVMACAEKVLCVGSWRLIDYLAVRKGPALWQ